VLRFPTGSAYRRDVRAGAEGEGQMKEAAPTEAAY
jgi:hypothetical protein